MRGLNGTWKRHSCCQIVPGSGEIVTRPAKFREIMTLHKYLMDFPLLIMLPSFWVVFSPSQLGVSGHIWLGSFPTNRISLHFFSISTVAPVRWLNPPSRPLGEADPAAPNVSKLPWCIDPLRATLVQMWLLMAFHGGRRAVRFASVWKWEGNEQRH